MITDPREQHPTLDEATHTYTIGRRVIPGVTRVIDAMLRKRYPVSPQVWEKAQELGTLVHDATELFDKDDLDEDSIDKDVEPYLEAWKKFRREMRPTIRSIERIVYHPMYGFAGKEDREVQMEGVIGTLDIKSGVLDPTHDIQLAAYMAAKNYNKPYIDQSQRGWCVYLRDDGDFKLARQNNERDNFNIFLAALQCYNWRANNG